jgi:methyltransferase (TIGR00027 family)
METDTASRTALGTALGRAVHQLVDDDPKVLADPLAVRLVPAEALPSTAAQREALRTPAAAVGRAMLALRSRCAEDALAQAVAAGVRQYVLLGAGLDTFAYRRPAYAARLRIFEVDHPATPAWKRVLLADADIVVPANLCWAPVDFERSSLASELVRAGFDTAQPAFFSWLGVTQYLTEDAIESTLRFVASLPSLSGLALSFIVPDDLLDGLDLQIAQRNARGGAAAGEPWLTRYRPEVLGERVEALGFQTIRILSPEEADARYFTGRRDGLRAPRWLQMLRASV